MRITKLNFSTAVIPQRMISGWRLPAIGILLYSIISIPGGIFDMHALFVVGAVIMFLCVLAASYRYILSLRVDKSIVLAVSILFFATLATLYNPTQIILRNFVKLSVIYLLYILMFNSRLVPIYSTPLRKVFFFALLLLGAVSLMVPGVSAVGGVLRMSGVFVNANNLGLMTLALLFLINEDRDGRLLKTSLHVVIIVFLLLSATSGALLAYIGAILFRYLTSISFRKLAIVLLLLLSGVCIILLVGLLPVDSLENLPILGPVQTRLVGQFALIKDEFARAVSGYSLDYSQFSDIYGQASTSGLWRLAHWRHGIDLIANASAFQLLFGHGIGSSGLILGGLPHNDYLRIAVEQGVFGLILSLAFFIILFRRIDPRYRYCIIAVALYCISENNLDNLLFMSIFVMFLATAQNRSRLIPKPVNMTTV